MLLFGHRFIKSESFYHITNIDDIINTPPSSTLYFEFCEDNLDIISYANENKISLALSIRDVKELIFASSLNAKYIVVENEMAKTAQNIAQEYLLDAKILVKIEKDEAIEEIALLGIDGVVYSNAIIKITS